MAVLGVVPGLPLLPFALIGGLMAFVGVAIPRRIEKDRVAEAAKVAAKEERAKADARASIKEQLKSFEIELVLSKELNAALVGSRDEIGSRIAKMRRKFARQYGFVVPEIRLSDDIKAPPKTYQIKIHGAAVATQELRVKDCLVIIGDGPRPNLPGDEVREPAFGMRAIAIPEAFVKDAKRLGFKPVDPVSVLLTHLSEVIHNNLAQLLSFKDMRALLDRLEPEYKRLLDDMSPSQISQSGLLATLKLLLAERVSIRNLNLILEAVAEIAPHARRPEQIVEHVRIRLCQQICGDLADNGALSVLQARQSLGSRLPSEPQARRQGRRDRIRHRPAADGAIRRRGFGRDPQADGRAAPVRHRHRRRDPPLRADDHRAHVPDPGGPVAARNRARLRDQVARDDRVTALVAGALAAPHEALAPKAAIGAFVLFCRIGACLMLAPGFSSAQIPAQVRLFVALAVTLTLTPLLLERVPGAAFGDDPIFTLKVIAVESLVGGLIGFLARIFYLALEALAVGAATMLGFSNPFGFQVEGDETMAPLATLISLAAIALLFAANLHWELLRGLVASYDVIPVGADFNARLALKQVADALGELFRLSLRIASPYVIYALVANLALALVNRLTPQVQVFFVAMPFVVGGRPHPALFHHQAGDRRLRQRLWRLAHFRIADEETSRRADPHRPVSGPDA